MIFVLMLAKARINKVKTNKPSFFQKRHEI